MRTKEWSVQKIDGIAPGTAGWVRASHSEIAYTPRRCREYSWAVYKAMRECFSVELTPEKFGPETQFVNYLLLLIDDIIAKAWNGEAVYRATYPAAWRVLDKNEGFGKNEYGGEHGGQSYGAGSLYGQGNWQKSPQKPGNDGQKVGGGSEGSPVGHVHPKIAAMMKPVWEVHPKKVGISALCTGAGISILKAHD
jgi:hypothetical protein